MEYHHGAASLLPLLQAAGYTVEQNAPAGEVGLLAARRR